MRATPRGRRQAADAEDARGKLPQRQQRHAGEQRRQAGDRPVEALASCTRSRLASGLSISRSIVDH